MPDRSSKVLVTGASGFVGSNLLDALREASFSAIPVGGSSGFVGVCCDFSREFDLSGALVGADCVVHLAARAHMPISGSDAHYLNRVNVEAPLALARQAAAAGVRRFVFLSSIGVCGSVSAEPFRVGMVDAPHDAYSESKQAAEEGLKTVAEETGLELVIVRPPLVYGEAAPGNFPKLKKLATMGLPLPFAGIRNKRSFISVLNLADFLVQCVQQPAAAGEIFLVADSETVTTVEFIRGIASAAGRPCRLFPVPQPLVSGLFSLIGKKELYDKVFGNLEVDASHARQVLGWQPPVSLKEGLRRAVTGVGSAVN